jgi:hypothetical protein
VAPTLFEASMNVARIHRLVTLALCSSFAAILPAQTPGSAVAKSTPPPAPAPQSLTATYPQIVRISYLDGDVRVARGEEAEKQTGATWEKAVANLPIETGYSLVTGVGRAEIEFEDASTIYLADHSVLTFNNLRTVGGVPHTELSLQAGTATLHVHPASGETFIVKTPTDSLTTAYPGKAYLRLTSFTDAIAVTPQKDESYQLDAPGSAMQISAKGQTQFFNDGKPVTPPAQSDAAEFAAWDSWVAGRAAQRSASMKAVMKSAGLNVSLPGLADLNGRGAFSPCAPYGTCWDPPADPNQQPTTDQAPGAPQSDFSLVADPASVSMNRGVKVTVNLSVTDLNGFSGVVDITSSLPSGFICASCAGQIVQGQALAMQLMADLTVPDGTYTIPFTATSGTLTHQLSLVVYINTTAQPSFPLAAGPTTGIVPAPVVPIFPCYPAGVQYFSAADIRLGHGNYLVPMTIAPYTWAVCHEGTWIYRQNHYVWVVSGRKHHHPPIHWIKDKHSTGYVPIHPRDVTGKPPVNRRHDVYVVSDKKGTTVERTQFDANSKIELLSEPPKEFRNAYLTPLERADDPLIAAHTIEDKQTEISLSFDARSQTFVRSNDVAAGGKISVGFSLFGGHNSNLRAGADGNVRARGNIGGHSGAQPAHISTHISTHIASAGLHGAARVAHAGGAAHAGGGHAGGGGHGGGHR